MNAQAEQMKYMVNELVRVVSGSSARLAQVGTSQSTAGPKKTTKTQARQLPAAKPAGRKSSPEEVIPFDEDDFADF